MEKQFSGSRAVWAIVFYFFFNEDQAIQYIVMNHSNFSSVNNDYSDVSVILSFLTKLQ